MCGIAGVWWPSNTRGHNLTDLAAGMSACMLHRGPDDAGTWVDDTRGIGLGFRRLAIIDLSEHGHQPMASEGGRFHIVFNGEIYNYQELAAELATRGRAFRGHSDTEVALAAFEEWGIEAAVSRFIGMFAIALWDARSGSLHLIRDRLGIKPLFIYQHGQVVAFASELKAFSALPDFRREIDHDALGEFFRHLYVPAPRTIYRSVSKLLPGHILEIRDPGNSLPPSRPYWSLEAIARRGLAEQFDGTDAEAVDMLDSALVDAVRLRMRADVPVGAFLSGGVDSSAVVALMQEVSPRPVRTFTIGFDNEEHDESVEAAAVARHLGTDHREIRLAGAEALDLVPQLADIFDEPLADPSQLPTFLICRAAREEVTVAVSGDGGDELFAGYNRYAYGAQAIPRATRLPALIRRPVGASLTSIRPATWDRLNTKAAALLGGSPERLAGEKVHKLGRMLGRSTPADMYLSLVSAWQNPPLPGHGVDPRAMAIMTDESLPLLSRMMLADQQGYLPDDLLAKVDRTSMGVSLEVRVPILDHRIVELSWRLPHHLKLRDGRGKWVLRQVLERRVPRVLIDRPKVGFSVPLAAWLRGPLRDWAEDRLDARRLAETPGLDVARIRSAWKQFSARATSDCLALWTVLMFESWRERWM